MICTRECYRLDDDHHSGHGANAPPTMNAKDDDGYRLSALGIVNCLGSDREAVRERVLRGDASRMTERDNLVPAKSVRVGEVRENLPDVPAALADLASRNAQLLLVALAQIEGEVRDAVARWGASRVGVVVGSSTSGIATGEDAVESLVRVGAFPPWFRYSQQEIGSVSEFVARHAGVRGPAYTLSTACSASAKAFAAARNLLDLHVCDAVIVGGSDSLCRITLNGFDALELISPSGCNPMSRHRSGIAIGEGSALFLLTREAGGVQLLGVGESSDAYHLSAPDPSGHGAETAILRALADAGLTAAEIDYVNLHGTGTVQNDAMESAVVARIFGLATPTSSTKPVTGHLLGAAGATEVAFCWLMLSGDDYTIAVPPHVWDGHYDETLPRLRLAVAGDTIEYRSGHGLLSTSFAFGGSNCAVVIGRRS